MKDQREEKKVKQKGVGVFKIIWKEDSADGFGGNYTESPYNLICNCIVLVLLSVCMSAFLQVCYVQNDSQYSII